MLLDTPRPGLLHGLSLIALLWLGCSEGQVANPIDQSEGVADADSTDADVLPTDTPNELPTDLVDSIDEDGLVDQGDVADVELDTGLCLEGRSRCVGSAYEVCVNGVWKPTLCSGLCENDKCIEQFEAGTCEQPLPLKVPELVRGSTDNENTFIEWSSLCGRTVGPASPKTLGPESVYRLQLDRTMAVKFKLTPVDPSYYALYLRTNCYSVGSDIISDCGSNLNPSSPYEQISILNAGEYFVVVDDFGYDSPKPGRFDLETSEINKNALPACNSLRPILLDLSTGSDQRTGDLKLEGATLEYWISSQCDAYSAQPPYGSEMVYVFAMRTPGTVTIEATPTQPADARLYIYVRTECEARGTQIGCHATFGNAATKLTLENLSAGTYYLYVDSYSQSSAPQFSLRVSRD